MSGGVDLVLVQGSLQSPLLSPVLAALSACLQSASSGRALILALHRSPRQWAQVLRRLGLSELRLAADKRLAIVDLWEHLDFEPAATMDGGQGDAVPCSAGFRSVPKLVDVLAQFVRQAPRDSDATDLWPTLIVWDDLTILNSLVHDPTEWRALLRILRALPGVDERGITSIATASLGSQPSPPWLLEAEQYSSASIRLGNLDSREPGARIARAELLVRARSRWAEPDPPKDLPFESPASRYPLDILCRLMGTDVRLGTTQGIWTVAETGIPSIV